MIKARVTRHCAHDRRTRGNPKGFCRIPSAFVVGHREANWALLPWNSLTQSM